MICIIPFSSSVKPMGSSLPLLSTANIIDQEVKKLRALGYSFCLVSPELWGRSKESINTIRQDMLTHNISVEAVCTKFPNEW